METGAMWMEEVVFPEVNDNINFLHHFFDYPDVSLYSSIGYHHYGSFIWSAYLHQKYDVDVFRYTWEAARYNDPLVATDSALAAYGTSMKDEMAEFAIWNFFTGSRAIPGYYYAEAASYPEVPFDQTFDETENDSIAPIRRPDGLGCNYLAFEYAATNPGILEIMLDGSDLVRWANTSIVAPVATPTVQTVVSLGIEKLYLYIPYIEDHTAFYMIPTVISKYLENNSYYLKTSVLPYGDANYDRAVNVGDATYLINYVFKGGDAPVPIMESGDANCDGNVNVADAVRIIQFVFNGGLAPCVDR
jgi:hypothetical protein